MYTLHLSPKERPELRTTKEPFSLQPNKQGVAPTNLTSALYTMVHHRDDDTNVCPPNHPMCTDGSSAQDVTHNNDPAGYDIGLHKFIGVAIVFGVMIIIFAVWVVFGKWPRAQMRRLFSYTLTGRRGEGHAEGSAVAINLKDASSKPTETKATLRMMNEEGKEDELLDAQKLPPLKHQTGLDFDVELGYTASTRRLN